jgi:peptidoglycan/LPS O-acetylase OafA/YrhL
MVTNTNFRFDINGLRAIAVIAVVLYHFNPTMLTGGFAGVDVFFVISGYLMTGIIFRDLREDTFSIFKFYLARVRRIVPALAVLCIILFVVAYIILDPINLKTLGKHIAASIGFVSNILYSNESGYFGASAHEKWLLHTWSLSVEWQFYILYPILLIIMKRCFGFNSLKYLLLICALVSYIFCIISSYYSPEKAFYLIQSRAWEMIVGGLVFLFPISNLADNKRKLLEWIGFILIFMSFLLIESDQLWPGYWAAIPVLGTFLVIQANRQTSIITNNWFFQKIGIYSYSIYLWHWPLAVGISYYELSFPYVSFVGVVLSVALGFISYSLVELHLGKALKYYDFKSLMLYPPILLALFAGGAGVTTLVFNGYMYRLDEASIKIIESVQASPMRQNCHASLEQYIKPEKACSFFTKETSWAVIGDSHVVELSYALAAKLKPLNDGVTQFSFSKCKPSFGLQSTLKDCTLFTNDAVEFILNNKSLKNVVVGYRWSWSLFGQIDSSYPNIIDERSAQERKIVLESVINMITTLAKNKDKVYILLPVPEMPVSVKRLLAQHFSANDSLNNIIGSDRSFYEQRQYLIKKSLNSIAAEYDNIYFLDPTNSFCNSISCFATREGVALYFDAHHMSVLGADLLISNELSF